MVLQGFGGELTMLDGKGGGGGGGMGGGGGGMDEPVMDRGGASGGWDSGAGGGNKGASRKGSDDMDDDIPF